MIDIESARLKFKAPATLLQRNKNENEITFTHTYSSNLNFCSNSLIPLVQSTFNLLINKTCLINYKILTRIY